MSRPPVSRCNQLRRWQAWERLSLPSKVQCGWQLSVAVSFDHRFLVLKERGAKLLGLSLEVLGSNLEAGQLRRHLVAFLEADPRPNDPHQPFDKRLRFGLD